MKDVGENGENFEKCRDFCGLRSFLGGRAEVRLEFCELEGERIRWGEVCLREFFTERGDVSTVSGSGTRSVFGGGYGKVLRL